MSEIQILLGRLEELREQLHALIRVKPLTDPEVLALSRQLDSALNEYRLLRARTRDNLDAHSCKIL